MEFASQSAACGGWKASTGLPSLPCHALLLIKRCITMPRNPSIWAPPFYVVSFSCKSLGTRAWVCANFAGVPHQQFSPLIKLCVGLPGGTPTGACRAWCQMQGPTSCSSWQSSGGARLRRQNLTLPNGLALPQSLKLLTRSPAPPATHFRDFNQAASFLTLKSGTGAMSALDRWGFRPSVLQVPVNRVGS